VTPQPELLLCADIEMPGREVAHNAPMTRDAGGHPVSSSLDVVSRALLNSTTWGTCWIFCGATNGAGYGQISLAGRKVYVHRAVYEHCRRPIPAGLVLDHLCGNRSCFNPDHLEAVTQQVNTLRALRDPRTHCAHGHAWTTANTYLTSHGARQCRACKADRQREHRLRAKRSH
jgi:hypothetical protein